MKGALLEVLLVLAVGIIVIGVWRGWFSDSSDSRTKGNEQWQRTVNGDATATVDSENPGKFSRDLQ